MLKILMLVLISILISYNLGSTEETMKNEIVNEFRENSNTKPPIGSKMLEKLDISNDREKDFYKVVYDGPIIAKESRTLEIFKTIKKEMNYDQVVEIIGEPDADIGSGLHIPMYLLSDGSKVIIGFSNLNKPLLYLKHLLKDGSEEVLIK